MTDVTPQQIAGALSGGDDPNEVLNGWVSVNAEGPVARITFTPVGEGGDEDDENAQQFRAVVVEGETAPIVLERPDPDDALAFEGEPYDGDADEEGWQVCAADSSGRTTVPDRASSILFRGSGHISLGEAERFAAALAAMVDAVKAAQAEQGGDR